MKTHVENFKAFMHQPHLMGVAIVVLVFIALIAFFSFFSSQNKEVSQAVPTPTSISGDDGNKYQEQTAKDSGVINFSENSEIAQESQKEVLSDGSIRYTFESENPNRSDIIIVKNGALIFARHAVVGAAISEGYQNLLGKQDHVIAGPTFYGKETSIYYYSTGGTALIVDPKTKTTYEEFTFQPPISLAEFMDTYKVYTQ